MFTYRPVDADDVEAIDALHGDPATNEHNPCGASPDRGASAAMLAGWLEHWQRHGFGYELAFVRGRLAGIEGARLDVWRGSPVVNLYWRLMPSFQGRGLSAALAQRALQVATQADAGDMIVARMRPENTGSVRVATSLGLHRRADLDDAVDGAKWIIFSNLPAKSSD